MAASLRSRSLLASLIALATAAAMVYHLSGLAFLPAAPSASKIELEHAKGAVMAALTATAVSEPAFAARFEEDDGFDARILAVLALPLFAVSWALFNVWRVAFRQVVRIGESTKGNPK
eukprot:TRINITY_DN3245_c0_g1_i12.p1 TRINITY_DN3245_c0_g1~~TRINITY_DN3245_c0_g1_i12.p1  ORF type:complete len:126 (+),score=31.09 TRINITY_DN3245_c0_g1_i12:25-378(+)